MTSAWRPSRVLLGALLLSVVLAIGLLAWGALNARSQPVVRRATVELKRWSERSGPITVALISDIHIGNIIMDQSRLRSVVAEVDGLDPDVVLIAGDFVVGHSPTGAGERAATLTQPLSKLRGGWAFSQFSATTTTGRILQRSLRPCAPQASRSSTMKLGGSDRSLSRAWETSSPAMTS